MYTMNEIEKGKFYILSCYRKDLKKTWYVRERKGEGHPKADWGYVDDYKKAVPMSWYWARRFRSDMTYCGQKYTISEAQNG